MMEGQWAATKVDLWVAMMVAMMAVRRVVY